MIKNLLISMGSKYSDEKSFKETGNVEILFCLFIAI